MRLEEERDELGNRIKRSKRPENRDLDWICRSTEEKKYGG